MAKKFLVCVDSDGCAMDTMDYKHLNYFGPLAAKQWRVADENLFLKIWNRVNLYSATRGCNRFLALGLTLSQYGREGGEKIDAADLDAWTRNAQELSNGSLKRRIEETGSAGLRAVLAWSEAVNAAIKAQKRDSRPFGMVRETLKQISAVADVAIVSSANREAVEKEWNENGLMPFVSHFFGQEKGSKRACIARLLEAGYEKNRTAMLGDSPGDMDAARANGVFFYPILFGKEKECWARFGNEWFPKLTTDAWTKADQDALDASFMAHMSSGKH